MVSAEVDVCAPEAVSRSFQYRRVVKPQLERQRRARVSKCLDALKDLMAEALQDSSSSGGLDKLEKADVLELTVEHLKKLRDQGALHGGPTPMETQSCDKFREGYTRCATEVANCLTALPTGQVNVTLGARLMGHLGASFTHHEKRAPLTIAVPQQNSILSYNAQQPKGLLMTSATPCNVNQTLCKPPSSPTTSLSLYTPPVSPISVSQQNSPSYTRVPTSPVWRPW